MGIGPALPARITAGEWAAGRRAPSAEIHDESAATLSPDSRNGSTAPAETATTVAAQPVSPPEAAGPKSGFMMASTDFRRRRHGTAVEAINGKRRSAVRAGLIAQR
jgi:hypothetical protein